MEHNISLAEKIHNYKWEEFGLARDMSLNDLHSIEHLLYKLDKKPLNIAEIGARQGNSTSIFALYNKTYGGYTVTCDPYNRDIKGNIVDKKQEIPTAFFYHIKKLGLNEFITLEEKSSLELAKECQDNYFDLVFIDGCHIYKEVKQDIIAWLPKVKNGGIICGHDCEFLPKTEFQKETIRSNMGLSEGTTWDNIDMAIFHLGVGMAVAELLPKSKICGDRIWYYKKDNNE